MRPAARACRRWIRGIDGKLRRHQHGVDAGRRDLRRHLLAQVDVVGELGAMAMEEHDQEAGTANVEALWHVQQHLAVVVGLVLPVDPPRARAVAAPAVLDHIEERLLRARHLAVVGERCRLQLDQLRPCPRQRSAARMHAVRDGNVLGGGRALGGRPDRAFARPGPRRSQQDGQKHRQCQRVGPHAIRSRRGCNGVRLISLFEGGESSGYLPIVSGKWARLPRSVQKTPRVNSNRAQSVSLRWPAACTWSIKLP